MALTLTGRLLCAANNAYTIIQTGQTPPSAATPAPPPSTLVGYLADPPCYVAGALGIDAALFAETQTEFILAFRGTEPIDSPDRQQAILDWANDLNAVPRAEPGMPGLVHPGFMDSLNALWPLVWPVAQAALAAKPTKPLYVTGHSKGGGIAPLAAWKLKQQGLAPYVCTFAAAKCGDGDFVKAYNAAIPHSVRYEYRDDIVPHLPPGDAFAEMAKKVPWFAETAGNLVRGYVAVGSLQFIDWSGQIVSDSPLLYLERAFSLTKLMLTFQLQTIADDHSLAPGSGYATGVCPGVWPPA